MADNAANAAPDDNEERGNGPPPRGIAPGSLAQLPYDPTHTLNTFLNESSRRETLEERIYRLQALVQELDTKIGQRTEQSHPQ
ncbi:uncharacterized protein TrAtP1_005517 [Trichoderma atroviride]|uniref:uncharacterized protein n=1 Tax=Hypocrea atroviridis TaxID=63577 RepID=UPI003317D35A|nr:hypothetical protein TrAtP1_005517 [Trichoderma atroviride]